MARIRSIKPEFWTSEQIAECSPNARLLFIGIWTFADDSGVHPASTKRLKMEVFPGDPFTFQQVADMVEELCLAKLLTCYEVNGSQYWRVTGWKHQKIDQPTYKHPLPDGRIPNTPNKRRSDPERSPNTSGVNGKCSPPEGRGGDLDVDVDVESKGRGKPPTPQPDWVDERDSRELAKAKKVVLSRIKAAVGTGDAVSESEFMTAVCEQSGLLPDRVRELEQKSKWVGASA